LGADEWMGDLLAEVVEAGIEASRRPSPTKLIDSTVIVINAPAGIHSQGIVSMIVSDWASLRMPRMWRSVVWNPPAPKPA
jgi:hypothetical protein